MAILTDNNSGKLENGTSDGWSGIGMDAYTHFSYGSVIIPKCVRVILSVLAKLYDYLLTKICV
jgi:hypothetical protein